MFEGADGVRHEWALPRRGQLNVVEEVAVAGWLTWWWCYVVRGVLVEDQVTRWFFPTSKTKPVVFENTVELIAAS